VTGCVVRAESLADALGFGAGVRILNDLINSHRPFVNSKTDGHLAIIAQDPQRTSLPGFCE